LVQLTVVFDCAGLLSRGKCSAPTASVCGALDGIAGDPARLVGA